MGGTSPTPNVISKIDTISQDANRKIENHNDYRTDVYQSAISQSKAPTIVFDIPVKSNRSTRKESDLTY
jgi:hypothetical protein